MSFAHRCAIEPLMMELARTENEKAVWRAAYGATFANYVERQVANHWDAHNCNTTDEDLEEFSTIAARIAVEYADRAVEALRRVAPLRL